MSCFQRLCRARRCGSPRAGGWICGRIIRAAPPQVRPSRRRPSAAVADTFDVRTIFRPDIQSLCPTLASRLVATVASLGRPRPLSPLFEKKRHARAGALVPQLARPVRVHGPRAEACLAAADDPVDILCVRVLLDHVRPAFRTHGLRCPAIPAFRADFSVAVAPHLKGVSALESALFAAHFGAARYAFTVPASQRALVTSGQIRRDIHRPEHGLYGDEALGRRGLEQEGHGAVGAGLIPDGCANPDVWEREARLPLSREWVRPHRPRTAPRGPEYKPPCAPGAWSTA